MTMTRLLELETTLDAIGWRLANANADKFNVHMNAIDWTFQYRNTELKADAFIYLASGLTGVTNDLADLLYLEIRRTGETFYFEKIKSPAWRAFLKDVRTAFSKLASDHVYAGKAGAPTAP